MNRTVLLIDNSYFHATNIQKTIPWNSLQCTLIIEYGDISGIEKMQTVHPDIVMFHNEPSMYCLKDLISFVKSFDPLIHIIVLDENSRDIPDPSDSQTLWVSHDETFICRLTSILQDLFSLPEDRDFPIMEVKKGAFSHLLLVPGTLHHGITETMAAQELSTYCNGRLAGVFWKEGYGLCLYLKEERTHSTRLFYERMKALIELLIPPLSSYITIRYPILVSGCLRQNGEDYLQTVLIKLKQHAYFSFGSHVVFETDRTEEVLFGLYDVLILAYMDRLLKKDLIGAIEQLENLYLDLLKKSRSEQSRHYVETIIWEFLTLISFDKNAFSAPRNKRESRFWFLEEELEHVVGLTKMTLGGIPEDGPPKRVIEAVLYVESHYSKDLSEERIAEALHLSSTYFSTMFREYMGMTFTKFVTVLRLKRAKLLVECGVSNIRELATRVGYADPKYFSKVFKREEGITPSEFVQFSAFSKAKETL